MAYLCQFCGEIEESDISYRCNGCGGGNIFRSSSRLACRDCDEDGVVAVCPNCGSEELER